MPDDSKHYIPFDIGKNEKGKSVEENMKTDEFHEEEQVNEEPAVVGEEEKKEEQRKLGITTDRRRARRKAMKLNKIFVGEVGEDLDVAPLYLYIVDISDGGMRITCDMDMPMDYIFHMKLAIDTEDPLDTNIKIIWKKDLFGGTKIMGIQFIDPSEKTRNAIREFMDKHSEEGKRRAYRLDRVLPVELEIEDHTEKFNTLTMDLSTVGMRISNPFPLPYDKMIKLKVLLDFEDVPVHLKARVVWQKETSYDQHIIGIEFTDLRGEDKGRINLYIDRAISGELDRKIVKELPEELFDFPIKRYSEEDRRRMGIK